MGQTELNSQFFFFLFRRFLLIFVFFFFFFLGTTAFRRRRVSQETADFRRKPADSRSDPFVPCLSMSFKFHPILIMPS